MNLNFLSLQLAIKAREFRKIDIKAKSVYHVTNINNSILT